MRALGEWIEKALTARGATWVITVLVAAAGIALALDPGWLHDEGLLTYGFARAMSRAPVAMLFFQKCKPVMAAIYAAPAAIGLVPFLLAHALVTACAVPLAAEAARALGARRPNVAALVVALSPFLLRSGGTGLSNADAVTAGLAVVLLAARGHLVWAGVLASASIWIRYETGLLAIALFVAALIVPGLRRMAIGIVAFPAGYLVLGALYHADVLWFLHWPPNVTEATLPSHIEPFAEHSGRTLAHALLSVSPVLVALVVVPWRALGPIERALAALLVVFVAAFGAAHLSIVPMGPLFVLGFSERYLLAVLPAVAILAARAADPAGPGEAGWRPALAGCAALLACALATRALHGDRTLLIASGAAALALALAASRWRALTVAPLVGLALSGPWLAAPGLERGGFGSQAGDLESQLGLIDRHPPGATGRVYTSSQLLQPYVGRRDARPELPITYVLQFDQAHELLVLASPARGQREIVREVLPAAVFGTVIDADAIDLAHLDPGDRLLLRDDPLLDLSWPPELRASALDVLEEGRSGWTIYAPRARDTVVRPP